MSRFVRRRTRTAVTRRRSSGMGTGPIVAFLLIASFGILFAGCSGPVKGPNDADTLEDSTFSAEDMATLNLLAQSGSVKAGTGTVTEAIDPIGSADGSDSSPSADPALIKAYAAMRSSGGADGQNVFRVTNDFVNIRSEPSTGGSNVGRIERGEAVTLLSFVDASWAKIKTAAGQEGYVSARYISREVSEDQLKAEQQKYAGQYFVNFGFVNVRAGQDISTEKIGEIPGQTIVTPSAVTDDWATVTVNGKQGYASMQFLKPFSPTFLVRQDTYTLPILLYHADQPGMTDTMATHAKQLRADGYRLTTIRDFYDLLRTQQQRDVRLLPKSVIIGVTGVTPATLKAASDALKSAGVTGTFFLETKDVGISGISEKMLLTLVANGFDVQSAGHTGDDLRGLPGAQLRLELWQSRMLLEEMTKRTVSAVLYPQGGVNDRVTKMAENTGYLFGISAIPDKTFSRSQFLRLPSLTVLSSMTLDDVMQAVK